MISIIIPTYNEKESIGKLLDYLIANSDKENIKEIIISDATNCIETKKIALAKGVTFLQSEKGRAVQMNNGAKAASGDIYYFLHADSFPPKNFDSLIIDHATKYKSGCFRMQFDSKHPVLKAFGWMTQFKSNLCRGGDQSLYVDAVLFNEIGGFNETILFMEDNEIIPRLKRVSKFAVIKEKITTSARRHRANGVVRLQFIFATIHTGYRLGISQERLLNYYNRKVK